MNNREAELFAHFASTYLDALTALETWDDRHKPQETFIVGPIYHIAGMATELTLKACLLENGTKTAEEIGRAHGHNLIAAYEEAKGCIDWLGIEMEASQAAKRRYSIPIKIKAELEKMETSTDYYYAFSSQLKSLNANYAKDPLSGISFRTRYPPKDQKAYPVNLAVIRFVLVAILKTLEKN